MKLNFTAKNIDVQITDDQGNTMLGVKYDNYELNIDAVFIIKHASTILKLIADGKVAFNKLQQEVNASEAKLEASRRAQFDE